MTVTMALEVPQELEERVRFWSNETRETPDELLSRAIERHLRYLERRRIYLKAHSRIRRSKKPRSQEELEAEMREIDCVMSKLIAEVQDLPVPDWVHAL